MDSRLPSLSFLVLLSLALVNAGPSSATTMAFYNKCRETVWPGVQPSAGKAVLARGGFRLLPNQAYSLRLPVGWSGRVWGRQGCAFDPATGRGRCETGDCDGALYCKGVGGAPPATLAEITLGQGRKQDFYDVSLVDGYNLGMSMTPFRGSGRCGRAGCVRDLNEVCPAGLAVRAGHSNRVVACKSACSAFGSPGTAAPAASGARSNASRRPTRGCSRRPARGPTPTPTTIPPAFSPAPAPATLSPSALNTKPSCLLPLLLHSSY